MNDSQISLPTWANGQTFNIGQATAETLQSSPKAYQAWSQVMNFLESDIGSSVDLKNPRFMKAFQGLSKVSQHYYEWHVRSHAGGPSAQAWETFHARLKASLHAQGKSHADQVERSHSDARDAVNPKQEVRVQPSAPSQSEGITGPNQRKIADLEKRLENLETTGRVREETEANESRKSGFMRALKEVFEFMGRWTMPFFNLLSAVFRAVRIGVQLLKGEEIDWQKEGLRMAGDLIGTFAPPIGAMANAGLNLYYNESELLGGVNRLTDETKKDNYFRRQIGEILNPFQKSPSNAPVAIAT